MNTFELVQCSKIDVRVRSITWCWTNHYAFLGSHHKIFNFFVRLIQILELNFIFLLREKIIQMQLEINLTHSQDCVSCLKIKKVFFGLFWSYLTSFMHLWRPMCSTGWPKLKLLIFKWLSFLKKSISDPVKAKMCLNPVLFF